MLPKGNRIISDFDFRRIRKYGRLFHSPFFSFSFLKENSPLPPRFGYVISTKVSKSAVKRNFLKRALRLPVEENIAKIAPGISGAFWVKSSAVNVPPSQLYQEVLATLSKAEILQRE